MGWLRSRKFWILVLVGALVALLVSVLPLHTWLAAVQTWLRSLGIWAIPAYVVIYTLAALLGLPNILLILLAGTLFGLGLGIAAASIADTLGAVACYWVGRTLARKRVKRLMERHPNFAQLDCAVNRKGWKILLLTRLSPVIPSNVLNYGFSCTKVNFWQYLGSTWLGMLPVIGLYVYLGNYGMNLTSSPRPETIALQTAGAIATIAAAIYTTRLAKRILSTSEKDCDTATPQAVGQEDHLSSK